MANSTIPHDHIVDTARKWRMDSIELIVVNISGIVISVRCLDRIFVDVNRINLRALHAIEPFGKETISTPNVEQSVSLLNHFL